MLEPRKLRVHKYLHGSQKKTGVGQVFSVKHSPGMGNLGTAYEVDPDLLVPRRVQDSLEDIQVQLISNGNGGYLIHSANPQ